MTEAAATDAAVLDKAERERSAMLHRLLAMPIIPKCTLPVCEDELQRAARNEKVKQRGKVAVAIAAMTLLRHGIARCCCSTDEDGSSAARHHGRGPMRRLPPRMPSEWGARTWARTRTCGGSGCHQ